MVISWSFHGDINVVNFMVLVIFNVNCVVLVRVILVNVMVMVNFMVIVILIGVDMT